MLKKRLEGRGTDKPEVIATRLANSTGEMKTLLAEKKTFTYRVINDNLEVSKRTLDFLVQGLYAEELTGKDTNQLIAETPELTMPKKSYFLLKAVAFLGIVSAGAYMYYKKKQE